MNAVIRWPGLGAFVVVSALLLGVPLVFMDTWIKRGVEIYAGKALGAQVDLESVAHSWQPFGLTLRGLAFTDPEKNTHNKVQIATVSADLSLSALMSRRLLIDQLRVDGVRFDQPRATPGEVYVEAEKPVVEAERAEDHTRRMDVDVAALVKKTPLATTDAVAQLQSTATALKQQVAEEYAALPSEDALKNYQTQIDALLNRDIENAADLAAAAKELDILKKALRDEQKKLHTFRETVSSAGSTLGSGVAAVDDARKTDYDFLKGVVAGDTVALDQLTDAIFGAKLKTWADHLLTAYNLVAPLLQGEPEAEGPKRQEGRWINFANGTPLPNVLIRAASVSVQYAQSGFSSQWQDITDNHDLLGRPTRFTVNSANTDQWQLLNVEGDMRFGGGGLNAHQSWELKGVALDDVALVDADQLRTRLQRALLNSLGSLTVESGRLRGDAKVTLVDMALSAAGEGDNREKIARVLAQLKQLAIDTKITGALTKPRFEFASDLDSQLGKLLGGEIGDAAKAKLSKLQAEIAKRASPAEQQVTAQLADWETLQELSRGKTDKVEELLKAQLQSAADQQKDKLKDELKKKLFK